MDFCIAVAYSDPEDLCEIALAAESAGFGGIVVSDHVIHPAQLSTPYPWSRYDQVVVHDFIFGGMENAGATTLTELCMVDDRGALA